MYSCGNEQATFKNVIIKICSYLLWWDFISCRSHVNFFIGVDTRNYEENSWSSRSSRQKSSKSEDDGSLILLKNYNN